MTSMRLYDVYYKQDGRWIWQRRTFHPFSNSEELLKGNIQKVIACRQRSFFGWDVRNIFKVAKREGYSRAFWVFIEYCLMDGIYYNKRVE